MAKKAKMPMKKNSLHKAVKPGAYFAKGVACAMKAKKKKK